jgi:hypothetical protein
MVSSCQGLTNLSIVSTIPRISTAGRRSQVIDQVNNKVCFLNLRPVSLQRFRLGLYLLDAQMLPYNPIESLK